MSLQSIELFKEFASSAFANADSDPEAYKSRVLKYTKYPFPCSDCPFFNSHNVKWLVCTEGKNPVRVMELSKSKNKAICSCYIPFEELNNKGMYPQLSREVNSPKK